MHGGKISGIWCFEKSLIDPSRVDIHPGNVLFRLPQVDKMTPDAINDIFGKPSLGTVTRRDGGERGPGLLNTLWSQQSSITRILNRSMRCS